MVEIVLEQLAHAKGLPLPAYATAGAAGADLCAAVPDDSPVTLLPGQHAMVPTGLLLAIPHGHEVQIRPRSGLAARHGVTVLNSPGTIDSDFRGEVQILLVNLGQAPFLIERGMRIAQMVVAPVQQALFRAGPVRQDTARGAGGFGSTGR
jgi:dUTP pyrophosphatase